MWSDKINPEIQCFNHRIVKNVYILISDMAIKNFMLKQFLCFDNMIKNIESNTGFVLDSFFIIVTKVMQEQVVFLGKCNPFIDY